MTLTLTFCAGVCEPGFSPSEYLELARLIECGDLQIIPAFQFTRGSDSRLRSVTPTKIATIVAALRAYANG